MGLLTASAWNHASAASGSPLVLTNPSTTVGDMLLVAISCGTSTQTVTPPASQGWVAVASSPSSGNAGANLRLYRRFVGASDPTSFSFSFGTNDVNNGGIVAITGADPTNPMPSNQISIINIPSANGRTSTTGSLTPVLPACLPIMIVGAQNPDSGNPGVSSATTGFTQGYIESTGNAQFHSSVAYVGPLTSDTTTPIQAFVQFASQFTTTTGFAGLVLIQPQQPSAITITPSNFNLASAGATQVITVAQSGSSSNISLVSSNTNFVTVSPSSVAPGGTATVTGVAAGTAIITATGA